MASLKRVSDDASVMIMRPTKRARRARVLQAERVDLSSYSSDEPSDATMAMYYYYYYVFLAAARERALSTVWHVAQLRSVLVAF